MRRFKSAILNKTSDKKIKFDFISTSHLLLVSVIATFVVTVVLFQFITTNDHDDVNYHYKSLTLDCLSTLEEHYYYRRAACNEINDSVNAFHDETLNKTRFIVKSFKKDGLNLYMGTTFAENEPNFFYYIENDDTVQLEENQLLVITLTTELDNGGSVSLYDYRSQNGFIQYGNDSRLNDIYDYEDKDLVISGNISIDIYKTKTGLDDNVVPDRDQHVRHIKKLEFENLVIEKFGD